jgi:hypothetical protein
MKYEEYNALLILANEQGIQLKTVADFLKFASNNYSKKTKEDTELCA